MFDKLKLIEQRYNEINQQIADVYSAQNQETFKKLMKENSDITPIVEKFHEYKRYLKTIEEAKELLASEIDKDFKELAELEIDEANENIEKVTNELKMLLLPKDENDDKNVIVEIRAGAGGDEAALFVGSLFRMYSMYAETRRWRVEILSENETGLGGYKEIIFNIDGKGAYANLKFESGVHRVQRVPQTESSGRIHTSTVTVAVLPEAEEVDVEINQDDLEIDTCRSSGAGGQHVNKTESAIRITHVPTGLVVFCQDERSQHKNKERAMKILCSRIMDLRQREHNEKIAQERKSQVGTGDRSERIRTYNFPQGRVTDHRIGLTLHRLESMLNGDLAEMIDALVLHAQSEKLSSGG